VDELITDLPEIFNHEKWTFSPEEFLREERDRVEAAGPDGSLLEFLSIVPGKQLLPVAAAQAGMQVDAYTNLIIAALGSESDGLRSLARTVETSFEAFLPARYASVRAVPVLA